MSMNVVQLCLRGLILAQRVNVRFDALVLGEHMNDDAIAQFDTTLACGRVNVLDHFHRFLLGPFNMAWLIRVLAENLKAQGECERRSTVEQLTLASRMGKMSGMALPSHAYSCFVIEPTGSNA